MELKRYGDADAFAFGNLVIRDLTPSLFTQATLSEIEVPIGANNPPHPASEYDRVYVGVVGEIEFSINGEALRVGPGDVLAVHRGDQFHYHNGGYEIGRMFRIQIARDAADVT